MEIEKRPGKNFKTDFIRNLIKRRNLPSESIRLRGLLMKHMIHRLGRNCFSQRLIDRVMR